MDTLLGALHAHGAPAVHLCMVRASTAARAFDDRLGFEPLDVPDPGPVWYLGRPTAQAAPPRPAAAVEPDRIREPGRGRMVEQEQRHGKEAP